MTFASPRLSAAIAVFMAALLAGGCTPASRRASANAEAVFVIVRHAEKGVDDPKDPSLSETGQARARNLAERLSLRQVSAVYATHYRRTQQTATPTATANGLAVRTYDAALPAVDFVAALRTSHVAGTTLVVGHSNTVGAIAEALCACVITPLREDEYDRLITIRIGKDRRATLEETRY